MNSPNQTFNIINISSNHQTKLLNRRFQRRHEIHWDLKACDGQRHVLARCLNRRSLANFMLRASCGAILPWSRIQKQLCRFIYVYKSEYSILTTLIGTKRVPSLSVWVPLALISSLKRFDIVRHTFSIDAGQVLNHHMLIAALVAACSLFSFSKQEPTLTANSQDRSLFFRCTSCFRFYWAKSGESELLRVPSCY